MAAQNQGLVPVSPFLFQFSETREVRSFMQDGEPWFVAVDVCSVLDYENPHKAIQDNIDPDDLTTSEVIDAMGRPQKTIVTNEAGLYSLILRSKKPEAKPFQRWVTHELLPQLRKIGFYGQVDIKTRIALGNHLRVLCQALARSFDAFEQQALLGRVREVCLLLGQSMPDMALLGKDPKQLTLRGV